MVVTGASAVAAEGGGGFTDPRRQCTDLGEPRLIGGIGHALGMIKLWEAAECVAVQEWRCGRSSGSRGLGATHDRLRLLLGSTRPPAEPGKHCRNGAYRCEECRPTAATDLHLRTLHAAHLALLVSLAIRPGVRDVECLRVDDEHDHVDQRGSRVQPSSSSQFIARSRPSAFQA